MARRVTKERTVRAVRPNAGLEGWYRKKLLCFIDAMHKSVTYWLGCSYRQNEPVMAADAAPKRYTNEITRFTYRGEVVAITRDRLRGSVADWFFVYVSDDMLRGKSGVGRGWRTQGAAEVAAKKAIDNAKAEEDARANEQRKDRKRVADRGLPADELQKAVRRLARRWQRNINGAAPELADYFSDAVEDRSTRQLKGILSKAGITVKFTMTPAQRDIIKGTVHKNVSLIRSIPAKHFASIEQIVMDGVTNGRDLGYVSKQLQKQYGVTKRRAAIIARDQNNKATSAMTRARQNELGITKGRWKHSGAGKHPRKSHVAANGKLYDINTGMLIDGEYIFPGEKINCKCTSQSIIPGFAA